MVDDVEYFDDNKGTNVGLTVAAHRRAGAERRLGVIFGRRRQGQDQPFWPSRLRRRHVPWR